MTFVCLKLHGAHLLAINRFQGCIKRDQVHWGNITSILADQLVQPKFGLWPQNLLGLFCLLLDTSVTCADFLHVYVLGPLLGYRISWEEYNRTNTRVTHYLPNVTLEYRVTGLTALTTYTIEVAAMTSKGQGQVSSSTISSGVPPGEFGS